MSSPDEAFTLVEAEQERVDDFAGAVRDGLSSRPRSLPCRFFYDAEGSRLFEAICELPEYYPTRAEREILEARAPEIAARFPGELQLVELGSGNAEKTDVLISALLASGTTLTYVPLDICREVLVESGERLTAKHPSLSVRAIEAEYAEGLSRVAREVPGRKLVLWLGSNIGNFDREGARSFLADIRASLTEGDAVLVGVDLRKDAAVLEAAYDDAAGVTAEFNRNLLARINRELGGTFDVEAFRHVAAYDVQNGRVDMFLESVRDQEARVEALSETYVFTAGERIHTESSYKYSLEELGDLATRAGLALEGTWLDSEARYALHLLSTASAAE